MPKALFHRFRWSGVLSLLLVVTASISYDTVTQGNQVGRAVPSAPSLHANLDQSGQQGTARPTALSVPDKNPLAGCQQCHVDVEVKFTKSLHFQAKVACTDCHGQSQGHLADENNEVKPDEVFAPKDVDRLCGRCHACSRPKEIPSADPSSLTRQVCTECHGSHRLAVPNRAAASQDPISRPSLPPDRLRFNPSPRPWGDTFLPKSRPPARHLMVVEVGPLTSDERIALTCLQGLTSREQPQIWLVRGPEDRGWLDWHQAKGHVDSFEIVADWTALFRQHASACQGAIVPDPHLYRGDLLAVNVAACEDWIVATPELAARLGVSVKLDWRGRFKTYAEGMRWVWDHYKSRLSRHLCDYLHPLRLKNCAFAYDFQWRAVMVWIAGVVDAREPGADLDAERQLLAEIFAELEPNVAVLGFPYAGEGVGPGEPDGVALASRYAKGLVCTDSLANTCVMSGVRLDSLTQPAQPPAPPLEQNKIYLALVMSDGDNQNTWMGFFKRYFEHPSFGKFPLAFGLGPPIRELMPAVAQWYYEHATSQTEFIADVSGVAYVQPDQYGLAYSDRDRVVAGFLEWTSRLMQSLDLRTVRTVGGSDDNVARYARSLPFCHSIFADMGRYSGREGIDHLTYALPDGLPVFRAVTSWRYGKAGFLREVREQVGTRRPAFVNGFVHCWTFGMDDLAHLWEQRDTDMVFVTPAQLAALYRQARDRGWTGKPAGAGKSGTPEPGSILR